MGLIAKIKAAWGARAVIKDATKEVTTMDGTTKPGYLTTEFWGKNIMHIIVFYNTFFHKNLDPNMGIAAMTALEVAYGAGRSLVKAFKDLVALYKSNFQKAPVVVVPAAGPTPAQ